ncbi:unnamed protein product [Larinioides sclopetarius]|uniref:Uncharacterized protein n=1 Tax=Larinioides sclopetarius TaxID=280406 RepID=A0AAV1ZSG3_9ARAC
MNLDSSSLLVRLVAAFCYKPLLNVLRCGIGFSYYIQKGLARISMYLIMNLKYYELWSDLCKCFYFNLN